MKGIIISLFYLPLILYCQIQVSNVDFKIQKDDYPRKGFIKLHNEEYFIEQGGQGTNIYRIDGKDLKLQHQLQYRPADSHFSYTHSNNNSNSGIIHEGSILYEIYSHYIYRIDILTGELIEIIDLSKYNVRIESEFTFGQNYFYFKVHNRGTSLPLRLDRNTGQLDTLEQNSVFVDSKLYWLKGSKLHSLDMETKETFQFGRYFIQVEQLLTKVSNSDVNLLIRDYNGVNLIMKNNDVISLNCDLPYDSKVLYISKSRLAYELNENGEITFTVLDITNCDEVYSKKMTTISPMLSYTLFDKENIFNEYFFFGFTNDWQGDGDFYIYDIAKDEAYECEIFEDFLIMNNSVRYGDNLYFPTNNHVHHIGGVPNFYRINLQTKEIEKLNKNNDFITRGVVVGEHQDRKKLNVYYLTENDSYLEQIDDINDEIYRIKDFYVEKNIGIQFSTHPNIWVENKYFFVASGAIYVTENDETKKLIDLSIDYSSNSLFKKNGEFLHILAEIENEVFAIKINTKNLVVSRKLVKELNGIYGNSQVTSNAIVILGFLYNSDFIGYYDVILEEYKYINELKLPRGNVQNVSGDIILYRTYQINDRRWYLINILTGQFILVPYQGFEARSPISDGKGGFYFLESRGEQNPSFVYINGNGEFIRVFENFEYPIHYFEKVTSNQNLSFAFDRSNDIVFLMMREGEKSVKTIYGSNLTLRNWHHSDQISIVEIFNGSTTDIYAFNYDSEPQLIGTINPTQRFIGVLEGLNKSVLVFNSNMNVLTFEEYDHEKGAIEIMNEVQAAKNYYISQREIFNINDTKFLLSFNEGIHGLEPWVYDINTHQFSLVKDMRSGFLHSRIDNFTKNTINGEVFFTAIKDEGDRQLFRLKNENVSTEQFQNTSLNDLKVFPVPSNEYIKLNQNYSKIEIISLNGNVLIQKHDYIKGDIIDLRECSDGLYFLRVFDKDNTFRSKAFVVQRQY